ncbi:hypothetical protein FJTKL_08753 [Diaporthe vaccinii]
MKLPNKIMEWPGEGLEIEENADKVPSTILYRRDKKTGKKTVKSWGFACLHSRNSIEWFKRYLDENTLHGLLNTKNLPWKPPFKTIEDVRTIYRDYMTELYKHIKNTLRPKLKRSLRGKDWSEARIDFLFSLPATFSTPDISDSLEKELKKAGFGNDGDNHKVSMDLTEPQASAVYTAFNADIQLCQGDVILTCDAGGGTTDLAILEQHGDEEYADLRELLPVEGINVGSTTIDDAFAELVKRRFKIADKSGAVLKNLDYVMMHSRSFQGWKHQFGKLKEEHFPLLGVDIPLEDNKSMSNEEAGISDGKLMLSHSDLRSLFDPSVKRIADAIVDRMDELQTKDQTKKIEYLVLSGGLGSSAYLKRELSKAFTGGNAHAAAPNLQILVAEEPQLAVAKGLVYNRLHKKMSGNSALKSIEARASYGIICLTEHTKEMDEMDKKSVWKDPNDGSRWVLDAVKWIIKKGETIDTDKGGEPHELHRNFARNAKRKWQSRLVICHRPPNELPLLAQHEDVFQLCTVTTDLSTVELSECEEKKAKTKFPVRSKKYFQIRYEVKFVLGPAHIKFELWFNGKQYAAPNKTPLLVQWKEGHSTMPPRTHNEDTQNAERWSGGRL